MNIGIKKEMTHAKLWDELDRLGTLGETSQEVKLFREPDIGYQQLDQLPLHNVVMCNEKYAVLRKVFTYIDKFGSRFQSFTYYFCGINDEHKYFIRPLKNFPFEKYKGNLTPTIEDIANWVNRVDEGFDTRVQGDVLAKFVHFEDTSLGKPTIEFSPPNQPQPAITSVGTFPRTIPTTNLFGDSRSRSRQRQLVRSFIQQGQRTEENIIEVEGYKFSEITDSPLKLGNHKLFTEGKIFASREVPFICVIGRSLILQHHEHAVQELVIPAENVVVLAAQRGRDFELKDLNYLKQSFD